MNRRLQRITLDDVPEELVQERAQVELDRLLENVRNGYLEAIEFVQQIAGESEADTYAQLEKAVRKLLEAVERDAILWEMQAAQDAYVEQLVDARRCA